MSMYSGKCDLADHIMGCGGWYDREGNPVKMGDPNVGAYYSDEYRDFLAFKKLTGGVIHQHKKLKITPWNCEEATKLCPELEIIEQPTQSGKRKKVYTYRYYGKEYTEKELNKHGVWITIDIHFNTLLDLIPYYPYIVSMSCGSTVYISQESFVDEEIDDHLENGFYSDLWEHYKKELQDHYREVVLRYFNPAGREHVEEVKFDDKGIGHVSHPIDENFDLEWRWSNDRTQSHWTSPKIVNAEKGEILISEQDLNNYIGNTALVYYVEAKEHPVWLG